MPNQVQFTTAYFEELAVEQDEAAEELANAKAETNGLAAKLVWDHGLISAVFWGSMFSTEREREAACDNMIATSNAQAANLRAAAAAYTSTDAQSKENLSKQMLQG